MTWTADHVDHADPSKTKTALWSALSATKHNVGGMVCGGKVRVVLRSKQKDRLAQAV